MKSTVQIKCIVIINHYYKQIHRNTNNTGYLWLLTGYY